MILNIVIIFLRKSLFNNFSIELFSELVSALYLGSVLFCLFLIEWYSAGVGEQQRMRPTLCTFRNGSASFCPCGVRWIWSGEGFDLLVTVSMRQASVSSSGSCYCHAGG